MPQSKPSLSRLLLLLSCLALPRAPPRHLLLPSWPGRRGSRLARSSSSKAHARAHCFRAPKPAVFSPASLPPLSTTPVQICGRDRPLLLSPLPPRRRPSTGRHRLHRTSFSAAPPLPRSSPSSPRLFPCIQEADDDGVGRATTVRLSLHCSVSLPRGSAPTDDVGCWGAVASTRRRAARNAVGQRQLGSSGGVGHDLLWLGANLQRTTSKVMSRRTCSGAAGASLPCYLLMPPSKRGPASHATCLILRCPPHRCWLLVERNDVAWRTSFGQDWARNILHPVERTLIRVKEASSSKEDDYLGEKSSILTHKMQNLTTNLNGETLSLLLLHLELYCPARLFLTSAAQPTK